MAGELGGYADLALSHDPAAAMAAVTEHVARHGHSAESDAIAVFAQVLTCQFDAASAWHPEAEDPLTCALAGFVSAVCLAQVPAECAAPEPDAPYAGLHAFVLVEAAMSAGQITRAEALARQLEPLLGSLAGGTYWAWNRVALARALVFQGRFTEARETIEAALADPRRDAWPAVDRIGRGVRAFVAAHEGDPAPAASFADSLAADLPDPRTYLESAAFILAAFAQQAAGRITVLEDLLLTGGGGRFLPRFQVVDRVYAFEMLVEAALAAEDPAAARDWLDLAEAHVFEGHDMAGAAVSRCRARLAIALDDSETLDRESVLSRERAALAGGYLEVLRSQLLQASASRTREPAQVSVAEIEAVAARAASTGARVLRDWAVRELGLRGRRLRNVPGVGWDRLTDRQRLVASFAAQGLRNREIAARLVLSERTVEGHIAAVLDALGAPSRVGIGRYVPSAGGSSATAARDLTPRQRAVAELIAEGRSNAAIAACLGISEKTVEKHVADLFVRLQVQSRTAIAAQVRAG